MHNARHLMNYELVLLLFLAVWDVSQPTFSSPAGKPPRFQQSAFMTRENTELDVSEPIDEQFSHKISEREKVLLTALNSAGKRGQHGWAKVQRLYKTTLVSPFLSLGQHYKPHTVASGIQRAPRCTQTSEAWAM